MLRPLGIFPCQQQVVGLHDAVDPLVVHGRQAFRPQLPVQDRGNPSVAVGRPRRDQRGDQRHHRRVLRFVIAPTRLRPALQPVDQVGAGHAQGVGHDLHRKSPLAERTREGLAAARRRGRVGGRPPALSPEQRAEVCRLRDDDRRSIAELARLFRVSQNTIRRA